MKFTRSAGILLHPTSLPGRFGIGDLGTEAQKFVDFLESAGQNIWQVLPLGPTGFGDSPYQTFSAFAGNAYLISPEKLAADGLLEQRELQRIPVFDPHRIDFGRLIEFKTTLLQSAYRRFASSASAHDLRPFEQFRSKKKKWLGDYALFMALKDDHKGAEWSRWDSALVLRQRSALELSRRRLADKVHFHEFLQYIFFKQWSELKSYANSKGIKILGDLPIFIAYDSTDVWAHKNLFDIEANGTLLTKAGVPPDYFSPTGQLWGNPLYRWKVMEKDDFLWWRTRISSLFELVDAIRIDHFRGFAAYWEIPGDAPTAERGRWVNAPGRKFFRIVKKHLGDLPIFAEDLGLITKPVITLRDEFGFPGMKILQFAFGTGMERRFLPHNLTENCAVYTGSHDNDTTRGYFDKAKTQNNDIYSSARNYLGYEGEDLRFELIRSAYASVASTVIIPMQDILNLGSEARMNFPGRPDGNWVWRFSWDQIGSGTAETYRTLAGMYDRPPADPKDQP